MYNSQSQKHNLAIFSEPDKTKKKKSPHQNIKNDPILMPVYNGVQINTLQNKQKKSIQFQQIPINNSVKTKTDATSAQQNSIKPPEKTPEKTTEKPPEKIPEKKTEKNSTNNDAASFFTSTIKKTIYPLIKFHKVSYSLNNDTLYNFETNIENSKPNQKPKKYIRYTRPKVTNETSGYKRPKVRI